MKRLLPFSFILTAAAIAFATSDYEPSEAEMIDRMGAIPDSLFENIKREDLLIDDVYVKLARDGWTQGEIRRIMDSYISANKPKIRGSYDYSRYSKEWLPLYLNSGGDSIYDFIDSTYYERSMMSARRAAAASGNSFDSYYPETVYKKRVAGEQRDPGLFRPSKPKPSSGRIVWAQLHPENPDCLMVIPDGGGIARTGDLGKHWDMISDRVTKREHRNLATHSAIPVDPDNWNHIFAFMSGPSVYETFDGGQTWEQVPGATHKSFKRGHAFRDSIGNLKFIGAVQNGGHTYWDSQLWTSDDKGVTWYQITLPDSIKDYRESDGYKGAWFQEFAFDRNHRNRVYATSSNCIYYFDDGVTPTIADNGTRTYNIKRMRFNVWNYDSTEMRVKDTGQFPFPGTTQAFLNINPNNPLEMWFATASRTLAVAQCSAIYRTRDGGKNWITVCEPLNGIGSGNIFGNESPYGWLGGFGVNYNDQTKLYGCSMSSAKSATGGNINIEYGWGQRLTSQQDDGAWYTVSNATHNADNHFIASHKSGRVFRGSDAGILCIDPSIRDNWFNIGGDMGEMLFYSLRVNEFGDQIMFGNTQDIDCQIFRNNRWGCQVGYEGSNAFINPYSGQFYYSNHGNGIEGDLVYSSWQTTETYPDVCNGNFYIRQSNAAGFANIHVVKDFGHYSTRMATDNASGVADNVQQMDIARSGPTPGSSTIWVRTGTNWFRYSHDCFETKVYAFQPSFCTSVQSFCCDPDDWTKLYIANATTTNKVTQLHIYYADMINKVILKDLTYDLPSGISCTKLMLHQGSGDLYFYSNSVGIYLLRNGETSWRYWTRGYNIAKSGGVSINYTTQEMALYDYGRGVWVADLETPSDRYFKNGFALKEMSNIEGRKTIGIDTYWTIPLYYNYKWTVNDVDVQCPYQYLTRKLNVGDRVQLTLTLRESPDVSTTSAVYTVTESEAQKLDHTPGKVLYSNGNGRVDLGYVDYFFKDFTIDFWIKPETSDGVILATGNRVQPRGGRGWWIGLNNGVLQFNYCPANRFLKPTWEASVTEEQTLSGGTLPLNQWSHVAVTQQQNGMVYMYVNGKQVASTSRIRQEYTLNNSTYLSLFADGYEESPLAASIDELKIWNTALEARDVRRSMYDHNGSDSDNLVYYNNFNSDGLEANVEEYSQQKPVSRVKAVTENRSNVVLLDADYSDVQAIAPLAENTTSTFTDGTRKLLSIKRSAGTSSINVGVYAYEQNLLKGNEANIESQYYTVIPMGYVVQAFDSYTTTDNADITLPEDLFPTGNKYKMFVSSATDSVTYWKTVGESVTVGTNAVFKDIPLSDLAGNRVVIAYIDNAIELAIDKTLLDDYGYIEIFENNAAIDFTAQTMGHFPEPDGGYTVVSSSGAISFEGPVYFKNGQASGKMYVDTSVFPNFGDEIDVTLRGEDSSLIPYKFTIINRILPDNLSEAITLKQGAVILGDPSRTSKLSGINTATFMTWVRIDNASALTGTKPLMTFRNSAQVNGIYLQDGNLRFWWNGSYPFSANTIYTFSSADIGKWVHVAIVIGGTNYCVYINGTKGLYTRTVPTASITTELMLGISSTSDTPWFEGAFDQTMVWSKALTQEEVLNYMQKIPKINDPNLIVYGNMDYYDSDDNLHEVMSNKTATFLGSVEKHINSRLLLNPVSAVTYTSSNTASAKPWRIPIDNSRFTSNRVAVFDKFSHNFVSDTIANLAPLNKEAYTVCWPDWKTASLAATYNFVYTENSVMADQELTLGIRPLGSMEPYASFVKATPTTNGTVTFAVPSANLTRAIEMMVFTANPDNVIKASMNLDTKETRAPEKFILSERETKIPIDIKVLDGTVSTNAAIVIKESEYARADVESIDPTTENPTFNIIIDRDKINKKGLNPVTINLMGVECDPLTINVALPARVHLSLDNDQPYDWYESSTVASLPIKVEWVQGLVEDVQFDVTTDLRNTMNSTTASLLTNSEVRNSGLEFYNASSDLDDGWNLIGNPFLADINLSTARNYDTENTSKFIYHYDAARKNFVVSDRTFYESEKQIVPFSPFFVQAMATNASFTVKPYAKTKAFARNNAEFIHKASTNANYIILELYDGDVLEDETKIVWDASAAYAVEIDEDAPKMWSLDDTADQIYTLSTDNQALAVNAIPYRTSTVPLGLMIKTAGTKTIRVKSKVGKYTNIAFYNTVTKKESPIEEGAEYTFDAPLTGTFNNQIEVHVNVVSTDVVDPTNAPYDVRVDGKTCIITGLKGNATIAIDDIQGRNLMTVETGADRYRASLSSGFYIVTIRENGKKHVTKIAIK